jgi:hypothetical protein
MSRAPLCGCNSNENAKLSDIDGVAITLDAIILHSSIL